MLRFAPTLSSRRRLPLGLPLGLLLPSLGDPVQNVLPILVQLQLGDDHFRRMHGQRHRLPVGLFAHQAFDVNDIFESVHGDDFAFPTFVRAACDQDLVVFADGDGPDLPPIN